MRAEEDPWERADGSVLWLHWEIRPWGSLDGLPEGLLILAENITARKNIEAVLRENEATIRTLLDTASQAILAVNGDGAIVIANRMVAEMFRYAADDLIGKPLETLIPPRLAAVHRLHREEFSASPKTRAMGMGLDLIGLRADGTEFPIEVSLSSVETKRGLLAVSFVSDITARKRTEASLRASEQKLRLLAASLLTAQEDERRTLARDLHDDVTQRLAFLSMELGRLVKDCAEEPACERLKELQQQTLGVATEVRRLSHGLHPSVIADFGLSVALEEFCDEYEKACGIRVHFDGPVEDSGVNDIGATCLYRVAQESVRNAVVHGRATEINVALRISGGNIELKVEDNGIGFSTDPFRSRTGIGIVSMTERIRLVNGNLSIASQPGRGCVVTASIPLLSGVANAKSEDPASG